MSAEPEFTLLPNENGYKMKICNGRMDAKTHRAVKVKVRVNVMDVLEIDQVHETFTVMFTLHFYYVVPSLAEQEIDVTYIDDEGKVQNAKGVIRAMWGYDNKDHMSLEISKKQTDDGMSQELQLWPTQVHWRSEPDWDSHFRVRWSMMNLYQKEEVLVEERMLLYCSPAGGHVFEKFKIKATFKERLELDDMPFDRQLLQMKFVSEMFMHQVQFKALKEEAGELKSGASRGRRPDSLPAEWCADRLAKEETKEEVETDQAPVKLFVDKPTDKLNRASFCVIIHIHRNPDFYVWNVIVVLFLVTTSSVLAYVIKPMAIGDRAAVLTTILLATLAHKMITVQWLPVKPYLTFLDKYVLLNFFVQFVTTFESCAILLPEYHCQHAWGQTFNDTETSSDPCWADLESFDRCFAYILWALWLILHLLFFCRPGLILRAFRRTVRPPGLLCLIQVLATQILRRCRRLPTMKSWSDIYEDNNVLRKEERLEACSDEDPFRQMNQENLPRLHETTRADERCTEQGTFRQLDQEDLPTLHKTMRADERVMQKRFTSKRIRPGKKLHPGKPSLQSELAAVQ